MRILYTKTNQWCVPGKKFASHEKCKKKQKIISNFAVPYSNANSTKIVTVPKVKKTYQKLRFKNRNGR